MKPQFSKKRRKGDLQYPWEYRGYRIFSSAKHMYNTCTWWALTETGEVFRSDRKLNDLCCKIDRAEEMNQ